MDRISIKVILASVSHISRHYRLLRPAGIIIINNYKCNKLCLMPSERVRAIFGGKKGKGGK